MGSESEAGPSQGSQNTLWIGGLEPWMDESFVASIFSSTGLLLSAKIIRNRSTGVSQGYGFLEFVSHEGAEHVLTTYVGKLIPGTNRILRLNWAGFGLGKEKEGDFSLFVRELGPEVSDFMLQQHFSQRYPSVKNAKIVSAPGTGQTKGYGFVRFGDVEERDRAVKEMDGTRVGLSVVRACAATQRRPEMRGSHVPPLSAFVSGAYDPRADHTNTIVFVGGITGTLTDQDLADAFSQFGRVTYARVAMGKGCGFVHFESRQEAEAAVAMGDQMVVAGQRVRVSWGKSKSIVKSAVSPNPMPALDPLLTRQALRTQVAGAPQGEFLSPALAAQWAGHLGQAGGGASLVPSHAYAIADPMRMPVAGASMVPGMLGSMGSVVGGFNPLLAAQADPQSLVQEGGMSTMQQLMQLQALPHAAAAGPAMPFQSAAYPAGTVLLRGMPMQARERAGAGVGGSAQD